MKRTFKTILCAAAVVMAAVSCQKSAEPVQPAEEGKETIDICVNGLMGEYTQVDQSKAQLVNNVRVSWEGDETVYVYDGTQCLGSLAASLEGTEDRYAISLRMAPILYPPRQPGPRHSLLCTALFSPRLRLSAMVPYQSHSRAIVEKRLLSCPMRLWNIKERQA